MIPYHCARNLTASVHAYGEALYTSYPMGSFGNRTCRAESETETTNSMGELKTKANLLQDVESPSAMQNGNEKSKGGFWP
jgi:hypothetical protein